MELQAPACALRLTLRRRDKLTDGRKLHRPAGNATRRSEHVSSCQMRKGTRLELTWVGGLKLAERALERSLSHFE